MRSPVVEINEAMLVKLTGVSSCPPEDCGGIWGYQSVLEAISDPTHEDMLHWLGEPFDPERFAAAAVNFDDPRERWKRAFETRDRN